MTPSALRIKYDGLEKSVAETANGLVDTYKLPDCAIIFRVDNGDRYLATLPQIDITPDSNPTSGERLLLGMDVINRFKRLVIERRRPYFEI